MRLTSEQFAKYKNAIDKLQASTASDLEKMLRRVWTDAGKSDPDTLGAICVEYARAIAEKYGVSAATVSAALWEDIYYNDTGSRLEALLPDDEPLDDYFGDAAASIVAGSVAAGDWAGMLSFLAGITTKAVHDYARRTQVENTGRVVNGRRKGADEARFMRVPTGAETCAFCIMLAGRGPVYYTELSAGGGPEHGTEFDRYHAWCDCEIIASFGKEFGVGPYDWTVYEDMYRNSVTYDDKGRVDLSGTLHNMRQNYGLK